MNAIISNIRLAKASDLFSIMYLIRECVRDMNQRGLYHWNTNYPNVEQIQEDINNERLYIKKTDGYTMAMFVLDKKHTPEYMDIAWSGSNENALIVRKFCIHPKWQNTSVEEQILAFIEKYAREKGFLSLRLDVAGNDEYGLNLFSKASFQSKGEFLMTYQKMPFTGLEKEL